MIEKIWSGESPLWWLLLPLSWLYGLVSGAIRLCYKLKLKRAWRAPVPVVVVGNLTAGGNGKTGRCLAGGTAATARYSRGGRIAGIWW